MRTWQEHAHDAPAHGHSLLADLLLYGAAAFALGAMLYAYFWHIRPRRKRKP